jgi:hypothetical protein
MYLAQTTRSALITAVGAILAVMFGVVLVKITDPMWGHTLANSALLGFLVVVKVLFFISYVLFVIQGFRTHWGWGCANLLLPAAALVFVFVHPKQAKVPAITWVCGLVVMLLMLLWLWIFVPYASS